MVNSFLEVAQGIFSRLRNAEVEHNDSLKAAILHYFNDLGDDADIPVHFADLCGNKDTLTTALAMSHDIHLQVNIGNDLNIFEND